jgi:hypothetical protein
MKKIILILLCVFMFENIVAQNAAVAGGGNATGSTGTVSYSIGQIAQSFSAASNGSVSEGLQQPFEISTLGNDDFPTITLEMSVYPNPTTTNVTLKISDFSLEKLSYQLFDITGKQIANEQVTNSETSISLENLNAAIYLLQVIDSNEAISNKTIKTFKIIKNQ